MRKQVLFLLLVVVNMTLVMATTELLQQAKQDPVLFLSKHEQTLREDLSLLEQTLSYIKSHLSREQVINLLDALAKKKSSLACKLFTRNYYQDAIYFIALHDLPNWSDCLFEHAIELGASVVNTPKWKNEQDWLRWVPRVPSYAIQTVRLEELRKEFSSETIQQALTLRNDWRDDSKEVAQHAMEIIWKLTFGLLVLMMFIVLLPYRAAWKQALLKLPLLIGIPVLFGYGIARFAPQWMSTVWTSALLFYSVIIMWPSMWKTIVLGCMVFSSFFIQDYDANYAVGGTLVVLYLFGCVMYVILSYISTRYKYTAFVRREDTKKASTFTPLFIIAFIYFMSWIVPFGGIGYYPVEQLIDTLTGYRRMGIKAIWLSLMLYAIQGSFNYDHLSAEYNTHVAQPMFQIVWMVLTVILMGIMTVSLFGLAINYVTAIALLLWCIRSAILQRSQQRQVHLESQKPE